MNGLDFQRKLWAALAELTLAEIQDYLAASTEPRLMITLKYRVCRAKLNFIPNETTEALLKDFAYCPCCVVWWTQTVCWHCPLVRRNGKGLYCYSDGEPYKLAGSHLVQLMSADNEPSRRAHYGLFKKNCRILAQFFAEDLTADEQDNLRAVKLD